MKFSKIFIASALALLPMLGSCVGDLNQVPQDQNQTTPDKFKENPREALGEVMAKCYSSLAVSGQGGPDSGADISGLDGGTSQWSRAIFMLNEFTTDEVTWVWPDVGVFDLCTSTWGSSNANIFGTYSRLYTHIAVCNDFLRLAADPGQYDIPVDASLRAELDQFMLEARALRDLSYFYVIDFFGNAVWAWDDMAYGEVPQQTTRAELFKGVTEDLESVLAAWPSDQNKKNVVYGRIGKDAVEALLCRFYLNAEVFTGTAMYDKVVSHAEAIIARHQGTGFQNSGLANDYLAVFAGNNDMFMPGGSLAATQNEILWGIPYSSQYTQPYGGTMFLIAAPVANIGSETNPGAGFMSNAYYGTNQNWACMHARQEFSEKFEFVNGVSRDGRTYLWATDPAGFTISNDQFSEFTNGYPAIKFTNCMAKEDGTLPRWNDPVSGLPRVGVQPVLASEKFPDTDLPIIRLSDVYLMYAEAALRGAGDRTKGLQYVNLIRARAGVAAWNSVDYNLNNMIDERARELYWENVRRTDLIRFGKFTSGYNWAWKNNVRNGSNIAATMALFPIPADVIATYGSAYKQNLGY